MDVHKRVSARTWRPIVDGAITTSNDCARSDPLPITNGGKLDFPGRARSCAWNVRGGKARRDPALSDISLLAIRTWRQPTRLANGACEWDARV